MCDKSVAGYENRISELEREMEGLKSGIVRRGKIIRRAKKKAYETKNLVDEAKGALRTLMVMMGNKSEPDKVDSTEKGVLPQLIDILDEVNNEGEIETKEAK